MDFSRLADIFAWSERTGWSLDWQTSDASDSHETYTILDANSCRKSGKSSLILVLNWAWPQVSHIATDNKWTADESSKFKLSLAVQVSACALVGVFKYGDWTKLAMKSHMTERMNIFVPAIWGFTERVWHSQPCPRNVRIFFGMAINPHKATISCCYLQHHSCCFKAHFGQKSNTYFIIFHHQTPGISPMFFLILL